jgi:hypothetical protein
VVSTDVRREKEKEHINYIWDYCPSYGHEEGKVDGVARLPRRSSSTAGPHDQGQVSSRPVGPETSQAEGFSEYS